MPRPHLSVLSPAPLNFIHLCCLLVHTAHGSFSMNTKAFTLSRMTTFQHWKAWRISKNAYIALPESQLLNHPACNWTEPTAAMVRECDCHVSSGRNTSVSNRWTIAVVNLRVMQALFTISMNSLGRETCCLDQTRLFFNVEPPRFLVRAYFFHVYCQ